MRTVQIFIALVLLLLTSHQINAQQTAYFDNVKKDIDLAKELYQKGKYVACLREFEKVQTKVEPKSELYSEAEFYRAVSALHAGYNSGQKLTQAFIRNYPDSPYINLAYFNMGKYQFDKKQYAVALRSFQKVKRNDLPENDRIEMQYKNGYSNLMQENNDIALKEFTAIKDANNIYARPASYYYAHIQYLKENYQAALNAFRKLNNDPAYSQVIPIYVSHIYYKQKNYSGVIEYTVPIIDEVNEEHRAELSKMVGDSYFHLNDYKNAIPYLESYFETPGPKTREENYMMGFCYYHSNQFAKAAELLEKASVGNDEITQNAYYHLADCFIKLNDKNKAKTAYGAAAEYSFNPKIKEDALFSYAKLTYELSYSPFNETIKAFDRYIAEYPNSDHNAEAYQILVKVYMVTKNYNDAIASIEKIQNKTPDILKAYQRVSYYRGLELFNNSNYLEAVDLFNLSLQNGSYNRRLNAEALYWKAEALYRLGDYENSITTYNRFLQTSGSATAQTPSAHYNLGYAYLKTNNNPSAFKHFEKYVNNTQGQNTPKLADAYNRMGDYHFLNTNYAGATENYWRAYNMGMHEADYALLQIAFCQGLQRQQNEKINTLSLLLANFPNSEYCDDALYESGRASERLGKNAAAVQQYQQIVRSYPNSNFYKNALLQLGLVNYNNGDFNKALEQYKEVAEHFHGTAEATSALAGIKNCYIELNNVDAYFAYVRSIGGQANVSTNEQDQLTYMAAERLYMAEKENAGNQLDNYLKQFPNGAYALNAHFYRAELLYKDGMYAAANDHYTYVANQPKNLFSEPALAKSSEMTFAGGQYEKALQMFIRLEEVANGKWNILKAQVGQMRCYMQNKNYTPAIVAAEKVKKSEVVNDALLNEANFAIGKGNLQQGNLSAAISPLRNVAKNTNIESGAEAKYLLAEIYFRDNKIAKAEEEIVDFIDKGTPYTYWLGKAFLLLADIYTAKNDQFQAKHTLKSLVENYNVEDDGIISEAQAKLNEILSKEEQQEQNAADSSFQMEIKQN